MTYSKVCGSKLFAVYCFAAPRVVLKGGKSRLFRAGAPLIYGGAVDSVVGRPPPEAGDVVVVTDGQRRAFGWGVYNPASMFRVRLMQMEVDAERWGPSSDIRAADPTNNKRSCSQPLH